MRLTRPTDFDILAALDKHRRNIGVNLALHLDRDRAYLNTRLPHLSDYGFVGKVGPATESGLYELTERGRAPITYRDSYGDPSPDGFETVVNDAVNS